MEIGAALARLELSAADPRALADFYARTFRLQTAAADGGAVRCQAPGRELLVVPGEAGQLVRAWFRFHTAAAFEDYRCACAERGAPVLLAARDEITLRDPEGRLISFLPPLAADAAAPAAPAGPARLQHLGVRTPAPAALADFYVERLGFVLSDRVLDDAGALTAAFLRTDDEHHSMAIFRAPAVRFDHFSCEAPGWPQLRDWADHMAAVGVDLAWGIGRHGPGNDTFLMVRDLDGNMGEVSSDLEVCAPDRPPGVWPHRPQTLNQWGVAIMRS